MQSIFSSGSISFVTSVTSQTFLLNFHVLKDCNILFYLQKSISLSLITLMKSFSIIKSLANAIKPILELDKDKFYDLLLLNTFFKKRNIS